MAGGSSEARRLAENFLGEALPRRWTHSQGVARQAASIGRVLGTFADLVVDAAWLHDIGYSPALARTGFHPLDGARYLRNSTDIAPPVVALVAHHSGSVVEARNRGLEGELLGEFPLASVDELALAGLTYSDITTGPDGQPMSPEERLAEILRRYSPDDVVHRSVEESSPLIIAQCRRIELRLGSGQTDGDKRRMIVLGTRSRRQPLPPDVVRQSLAEPNRDPARQWLILLYDETPPRVIRVEDTLVIWSSIWSKRSQAQVQFDIQGDAGGSDLRWTLYDVEDPGPALTGHMCKRLNELIDRDLRYSLGQ